ncbi:hypothetical protein PPSIR1_18847 [Plesiocystis pacifica SIR-1]|uniref:Uncharacterized protein n=1 Tax=Plesiocystis pacifica SIR-1 TaxID=391625 RepID=A6GBI5_9BACT|nr:hypothetical protein [Plesiocystis pacifica]EDM76789.1 hypothetical protein PPSIR1_18847 [Plesiocystis pacifica SIR-1]
MNTAQATVESPPRHSPVASGPLDQLARHDGARLESMYRAGAVPESLAVLDGNPAGRMLAVRGLERGLTRGPLRSLAAAPFFPWGGKSFSSAGPAATQGRGINRVHLGGRHLLFPFETRVEASAIDGEPTVVLDYDLGDNPRLIARIHDEIREVEPGLYLGPAMWKSGPARVLVLWFALDTRAQAPSIGWG